MKVSENVQERLNEAREELKRADHLLYVSLKYTRTVDVIKSLIDRLINCLERLIDTLLAYAQDKKSIKDMPTNSGLRATLCLKLFPDNKVKEIVDFYFSLKKIKRAEYKRSNEFRRHVTMTVVIEEGVQNIDIDSIKENFEHVAYYLSHVTFLIGLGEKPEEYVPWNQEKKED